MSSVYDLLLLAFSIYLLVREGAAQSTPITGAPLIISPSGEWDGPDGPWASFNLGIGDDIQSFRSLPSMSMSKILLPYTDWCNLTSLEQCKKQARFDDTFNSWKYSGFFSVGEVVPWVYNESSNGMFGEDTVTFGRGANGLRLPDQSVGGLITKYVPMSLFGLNARPDDFGSGEVPNLITNLTSVGNIPSQSISYTAGSFNRNISTSLILGGYDTSRFNPATTIQGELSDWGRYGKYFVAVNLSSIFISTTPKAFLSSAPNASWQETSPISIWIDSAFAHIWLPEDACKPFEEAFDLVWNNDTQLYLVNDTHHEALKERNSSVDFSLQVGSSEVMNYTLPYSAFDLQIGAPFLNGNETSYYFPLKRATRPDQYLLGRTFLQETYITVDYDRFAFNLSQVYPDDSGSSHVFAITPPTNITSANVTVVPSSRTLTVGQTAGIGIASSAVGLAIVGIIVAWRQRWGVFKKKEEQNSFGKAELPDNSLSWKDVNEKNQWEMCAIEDCKEIPSPQDKMAWELHGDDQMVYEMGIQSRKASKIDTDTKIQSDHKAVTARPISKSSVSSQSTSDAANQGHPSSRPRSKYSVSSGSISPRSQSPAP
ncbi:aspartic peptidase domain-containing protein [Lophiotrema nucula]|uniref:Aspartic peptidase domain-containing protein n=1 Tax=Lophiotrema nucula TaxID=690887 RepID=A0A6A5ZCE9_9PLEO|nr:aspartic peptidase domain-containing protein [Lophiotrema nucula]